MCDNVNFFEDENSDDFENWEVFEKESEEVNFFDGENIEDG